MIEYRAGGQKGLTTSARSRRMGNRGGYTRVGDDWGENDFGEWVRGTKRREPLPK